MRISVRFQRHGQSEPEALEFSPEEYFDPPDPGERLCMDSIPKHQDAYRYTPYSADELAWTVLIVTDGAEYWKVRSQLLDGDRCMMVHRWSTNGEEEMIHTTEVAPGSWHIVRTLKEPEKSWAVVMDSLVVERPGRLRGDQDFCEKRSAEDRASFGHIV